MLVYFAKGCASVEAPKEATGRYTSSEDENLLLCNAEGVVIAAYRARSERCTTWAEEMPAALLPLINQGREAALKIEWPAPEYNSAPGGDYGKWYHEKYRATAPKETHYTDYCNPKTAYYWWREFACLEGRGPRPLGKSQRDVLFGVKGPEIGG